MSVSILTAAFMLATAPVVGDDMPPAAPVVATVPEKASADPMPTEPPADPSEIIVNARPGPPPGDPLEQVNEASFAAVQAVDKAVIAPIANIYETAVPDPLRSGVRNFLANLHEPETFLNFLLQLKIGKALSTAGRFAINSTIGAAGLFDIAKRRPFNLKPRYNGFANTLGFYGVKPGPYFYLPLIGATTLRDFIGYSVDKLVLPVSVGKPFNQPIYNVPTGALSALDHRNVTDPEIQKVREGARDPYAAVREAYLQRRQAEIDELRGKPKRPPLR